MATATDATRTDQALEQAIDAAQTQTAAETTAATEGAAAAAAEETAAAAAVEGEAAAAAETDVVGDLLKAIQGITTGEAAEAVETVEGFVPDEKLRPRIDATTGKIIQPIATRDAATGKVTIRETVYDTVEALGEAHAKQNLSFDRLKASLAQKDADLRALRDRMAEAAQAKPVETEPAAAPYLAPEIPSAEPTQGGPVRQQILEDAEGAVREGVVQRAWDRIVKEVEEEMPDARAGQKQREVQRRANEEAEQVMRSPNGKQAARDLAAQREQQLKNRWGEGIERVVEVMGEGYRPAALAAKQALDNLFLKGRAARTEAEKLIVAGELENNPLVRVAATLELARLKAELPGIVAKARREGAEAVRKQLKPLEERLAGLKGAGNAPNAKEAALEAQARTVAESKTGAPTMPRSTLGGAQETHTPMPGRKDAEHSANLLRALKGT